MRLSKVVLITLVVREMSLFRAGLLLPLQPKRDPERVFCNL
jgi:hypothetical protein